MHTIRYVDMIDTPTLARSISGCGDENTTDQTLQRLIALGEFDNDPMFSDELRADLGKLDDNMIR